jgi:hypothetical protein
LSRDDAGDVFLKLIVVFGLDEVLSAFNGKYNMDVNLGNYILDT